MLVVDSHPRCLPGLTGQAGPYSPEGAALGGYGLDGQAHLGLRTAGKDTCVCDENVD